MWNRQFWQAAWDSPETRSNRFYGQMQKDNRSSCAEGDQDGARDFLCISQTENHQGDRKDGYSGCRHRERIPRLSKGHHAVKEITGDVIHLQAKEVADLRAGDEDGDAVGE